MKQLRASEDYKEHSFITEDDLKLLLSLNGIETPFFIVEFKNDELDSKDPQTTLITDSNSRIFECK